MTAQRRVVRIDRRKIEAFNEASDLARWMGTVEEKLRTASYAVELTALICFESRLRVSTIPTARRASTDRGREHNLVSPDLDLASTIVLIDPLNNWRHHGEDRTKLRHPWRVDPYSSALVFDGWKEREERGILYKVPDGYSGPLVWRPKTWLLYEGWRCYGLISVFERPGAGDE
jgi:hypothetical protein